MPMIISSADLRNQYADVSKKCHKTGGPVFVTKNGKGDVAILSMEAYDELVGANALRVKILAGVGEARNGLTTPAEDVSEKARAMLK